MKAAVPPSSKVALRLRARRKELGLSLHAVAEEASRLGEPIPIPTLQKIEQGKTEPGLRRLRALLTVFGLPFERMGELLEIEAIEAPVPTSEGLESLLRKGVEAGKRGDHAKGMAFTFAVRERAGNKPEHRPIRQKALLTLSIFAKNMGKLQLSWRFLEDLLMEGPDPSIRVNVLVQAASIWEKLGSVDASLAFNERAASLLDPEDNQRWGWVLGQKARCLASMGETRAALDACLAARDRFLKTNDFGHLAKYLVFEARLRLRLGERKAGGEALQRALEVITRENLEGVEAEAYLVQADFQEQAGNMSSAGTALERSLSIAVALGDMELRFRAHYLLWKFYERSHEVERAYLERQAALYFVRFIDVTTPEAKEARLLAQEEKKHVERHRKSRLPRSS